MLASIELLPARCCCCLLPSFWGVVVGALLLQLQHSGTLALVDILHSGFPHRLPLRPAAARLRATLEPLVHQRRQEQEKKVAELTALREERRYTSTDTTALDEEIQQQRRMLETLKHCNPAAARDRTLGTGPCG